jgi:hypothetical protein
MKRVALPIALLLASAAHAETVDVKYRGPATSWTQLVVGHAAIFPGYAIPQQVGCCRGPGDQPK